MTYLIEKHTVMMIVSTTGVIQEIQRFLTDVEELTMPFKRMLPLNTGMK